MGRINLLPTRSRQSNCRRRSRRTAGVGRQRAHRKRHRCGRAPHPGLHRTGRQTARPRRRRRRGHGAGRRAAVARAARDEQDSPGRRSRGHQHARIPRRGAAKHRVGLAFRDEDASARRDRRARKSRSTAARSPPFRRSVRRKARRSKSAICSTTCPHGGNS